MGICCIISVKAGANGLKARGMFLRDVAMLVLATTYMLFMLVDKVVSMAECVVFVAMYVVYVGMVVVGAKVPPLLSEDKPKWDLQQLEMKKKKEQRRCEREGLDVKLFEDDSRHAHDGSHMFLPRVGELNMRDDGGFQASSVPQHTRPTAAVSVFPPSLPPSPPQINLVRHMHAADQEINAQLLCLQVEMQDMQDMLVDGGVTDADAPISLSDEPMAEAVDLNDISSRSTDPAPVEVQILRP